MVHVVEQSFPAPLFSLATPTAADIENEPAFRRASPDFVRHNGGEWARQFLDGLDRHGLVSDRSRLLCQKTPIVEGAFAVPPNWHIDRMPGTEFNLSEHLSEPVTGVIACVCAGDRAFTTEFLHRGTVILDEPEQSDAVHRPGEYIRSDEGRLNWTTHQIDEQISRGELEVKPIEPNLAYEYDSTFYHKCPRFPASGGYRMILRVNTPPEPFAHDIVTEDVLIEDPRACFHLSEDGESWRKHRVPTA